MDDSAIMRDEIIDREAKSNSKAKLNDEETNAIPKNVNKNFIAYKIQSFYILLALLLITISLVFALMHTLKKVKKVSIYASSFEWKTKKYEKLWSKIRFNYISRFN